MSIPCGRRALFLAAGPILLLLVTGDIFAGAADSAAARRGIFARLGAAIEPVPEFHVKADISTFANHKNDFFREHYFVEGNIDLEIALLSVFDRVYWIWGFDVHSGMGYAARDIVFDPMDVNYGILPTLEYRFRPVLVQCGIEHRCFHEIDRREFPTIYFNKLFVAAGSPRFRLASQWRSVREPGGWTYRNRVQWYARWGYFVKQFGSVNPVQLNGGNDRIQEVSVTARYFIFRLKDRMALATEATTLLGTWDLPGSAVTTFWRQDLELDLAIPAGPRGAILFLDYVRDGLPLIEGQPRLSKDRILQFGVRFFL